MTDFDLNPSWPPQIVLDERLVLTLFIAVGLFLGLILVNIRWQKPRQDSIGLDRKKAAWDRPPAPVSSLVVISALIAGITPGIVLGIWLGPVLGIPVALLGAWLVPSAVVNNARSRWINEMDKSSLSLLQLLILKLQGGQSLLPALQDLSQNSLHGPLAEDITMFVVGPVASGANITQVLSQLRDSPRYKQTWRLRRIFRHLSTSTRAQMPAHKIAERLQILQQALVDTYALQLELESDLAQSKYSRWIVTGTLPITVFAFNFFAPEIAVNLFTTIPGQIAMVFSLFMVVLLNVLGAVIAKMPPLEL